MYSVLVVDDEPLVRLTLKNMTNWESYGFFFGYEAAHGKQAIEILNGKEHIDMVILDLVMPVMNGLELIEHIRLMDARPEILILSSHNDFALVRKAFKLGVHDYILKTEMEPETILAHLKEIATRLETDRTRTARLATLSSVDRKYLRRHFLRDLLSGHIEPDVQAKAAQFEIRLQEQNVCVAAILISSFELVRQRYQPDRLPVFGEHVVNCIAQILAKHPSGEVLSLRDDRYAVLLSFERAVAADLAKVYAILKEVEQALQHYLNIGISYGISAVGQEFESIGDLYQDAEKRLTPESRIVKRAKQYVLEHFADPDLCPRDISAFAEVTKNHLSYQFARETGENLRDYIHRVRIEQAAKLLLNTTLKVYEICDQVGYKNIESFSRTFKRFTGVSPNQYGGTTRMAYKKE